MKVLIGFLISLLFSNVGLSTDTLIPIAVGDITTFITQKGCGDLVHGQSLTRKCYKAKVADPGQSCNSEIQLSTCNNGVISDFTGTFEAESCINPATCERLSNQYIDLSNHILQNNEPVSWGAVEGFDEAMDAGILSFSGKMISQLWIAVKPEVFDWYYGEGFGAGLAHQEYFNTITQHFGIGSFVANAPLPSSATGAGGDNLMELIGNIDCSVQRCTERSLCEALSIATGMDCSYANDTVELYDELQASENLAIRNIKYHVDKIKPYSDECLNDPNSSINTGTIQFCEDPTACDPGGFSSICFGEYQKRVELEGIFRSPIDDYFGCLYQVREHGGDPILEPYPGYQPTREEAAPEEDER